MLSESSYSFDISNPDDLLFTVESRVWDKEGYGLGESLKSPLHLQALARYSTSNRRLLLNLLHQ